MLRTPVKVSSLKNLPKPLGAEAATCSEEVATCSLKTTGVGTHILLFASGTHDCCMAIDY